MNTKNRRFNLKKIPYYLALTFLTVGASLILGLLSFSGMFAITPVLSLAVATFALSVVYEGEIYLQNIKESLKKLFKTNYVEQKLALDFLESNLPEGQDLAQAPQFLKDYAALRSLLIKSPQKQKVINYKLQAMNKWFATQLINVHNSKETTAYAQELREWLKQHNADDWHKNLKKNRNVNLFAKAFSTLTAVFMGLGSTYLIAEAFSVIPWFAAISLTTLPMIIIPLALISGVAYGLLTYNNVTDFMSKNTFKALYERIKWKEGASLLRNCMMKLLVPALVLLAIVFTIFSAGTWWTVVNSSRPILNWIGKIPGFIMSIVHPLILGIAGLFFTLPNADETLEMVDNHFDANKPAKKSEPEATAKNWLQKINPFRFLLKVTLTPLRVVLFLGHLVSIGLTGDRMPGVPKALSLVAAIILEGFEDAHYFITGEEEEDDIPKLLLNGAMIPFHALATLWDWVTSKINTIEHRRTLKQAWDNQWQSKKIVAIELPLAKEDQPSVAWNTEHALSLIDQHKEKQLAHAIIGSDLAKKKIESLDDLKKDIITAPELLNVKLAQAKTLPVFNQHRLFASNDKTSTQRFIDELSDQIGLAVN